MSGLNHISRPNQGEDEGYLLLPEGFVERVGDLGLILVWAPQTKIFGHSSIGGFLSHCGWSCMNESMKFGVPIIAMPIILDQPVSAKLAVEIGIGMEIMRNNERKFKQGRSCCIFAACKKKLNSHRITGLY